MKIYDSVVVGAGISGLIAAQKIQENKKNVVIMEKSRGVGGRMATRRIEKGIFDHGAQFFTVRSNEFQHFLEPHIERGFIKVWCDGFFHNRPHQTMNLEKDGFPRYFSKEGMTCLPKAIAKELQIHLNAKIHKVYRENNLWCTLSKQGNKTYSHSIILTAPVPQSLEMIDGIKIESLKQLEKLNYSPCFALMILTDTKSNINFPGGIKNVNENIEWICDNYVKGISPSPAMTIHASKSFSEKYFDTPYSNIVEALLKEIKPWWDGEILKYELQRWRYCGPKTIFPEKCFFIKDLKFAICGDAFAGSKVEGAFLSGLQAAENVLKTLKRQDQNE